MDLKPTEQIQRSDLKNFFKKANKKQIAQNAIVFCDMYLQRLILGRAA